MARPRAKELTERELEVMHAFWEHGESTVTEIRDHLSEQGRELAYTTVATLIKILHEKEFLTQANSDRPFRYSPSRSFEDVSSTILGDVVDRLFGGARDQLLLRLFEQKKLSKKEQKILEDVLQQGRKS